MGPKCNYWAHACAQTCLPHRPRWSWQLFRPLKALCHDSPLCGGPAAFATPCPNLVFHQSCGAPVPPSRVGDVYLPCLPSFSLCPMSRKDASCGAGGWPSSSPGGDRMLTWTRVCRCVPLHIPLLARRSEPAESLQLWRPGPVPCLHFFRPLMIPIRRADAGRWGESCAIQWPTVRRP